MATEINLREQNGDAPTPHIPSADTPSSASDGGKLIPEAIISGETTADFMDLLEISLSALKMNPPRYISSIFGKPRTWIPPYRSYSEFRIMNLWRWRRMWKYLLHITIPSTSRNPPTFAPPFVEQFFFRPTVILQRPDHIESYTNFPEEAWFLINGIMTNDVMAQMHAAFVSYLFQRPVTLIQNSTNSIFLDLAQSMVGKGWRKATEPAVKAFPVIYDALQNPHNKRVVVIAHSQGTIIMSYVLRLLYALVPETGAPEALAPEAALAPEVLASEAISAIGHAPPEFILQDDSPIRLEEFEPLPLENLAKMEVYSFATCADQFSYYDAPAGINFPYMEHFGNENDLVARLGMLSPRLNDMPMVVDGPRYMRRGAWGHFLNEHYLYPIMDAQKTGRKQKGDGTARPFVQLDPPSPAADPFPRLFNYINGGGRLPVD